MSTYSRPPCDEAIILAEVSPQRESLEPRVGRWVLAAAILGSSMAFIDGTVVNVALPALQTFFQAGGADVQWVVESYALFLAALLLVGGSLGDVYGRRKTFLAGVVLFAVASVWCGLAQTIHMLIAARGLQGIGAALLVPGSLALISASFPPSTRGQAIGTWSGFTAITAAIGPLIGGWLVQHASWRWVFFLNVPIAIAVVLISVWRVPETHNEPGATSLDWAGALLATGGLGAVTYALIESSRGGRSLFLIGIIGVILLLAFFAIEARSPNAMLPLALFRSLNFSGANLLTLFLYAALGGVLYYLPLNLIQVQHYSPTAAGASLLPFILLMFFLSRWSGGLVARYGARLPLVVGPIIVASGFALLMLPSVGGSYWSTFFPAVLVLGFGLAVSVAPLTTVVMNSVSQKNAGTASGVNNAVSRVASLLALAVFGVIFSPLFARELQSNLQRSPLSPEVQQSIFSQHDKLAAIHTEDAEATRAVEGAFVYSFRVILMVATGLSVLSSIAAGILIRSSAARQEGC
jgi:EmrB/QacA subfamily drug resistance transporter